MKPPRFHIGHWEVMVRFWPSAWMVGMVVERYEGRTLGVTVYPLPMIQVVAWRL